MEIRSIGFNPLQAATKAPKGSPAAVTQQFSDFLSGAIDGLNQRQSEVKELSKQFAAGELADPHTLLIASEKSSLGLAMTIQVRNKMIEAYQEVMRTQM